VGRVVAVIGGSLLALASLGLLGAGAFGLWADTTQRDDAGFVHTTDETYSTSTSALVVEPVEIWAEGPRWLLPDRVIGKARVTVTGAQTGQSLFIGIGPRSDVLAYLQDSAYERVEHIGGDDSPDYRRHAGTAVAAAPTEQSFWSASGTGTGSATLTWTPQNGSWALVAMQADGSPGVAVSADLAAEAPGLLWVSLLLLLIGLLMLIGGVVLIAVAASRASRQPPAGQPAQVSQTPQTW
jgi:hypothetical protein